ncbi:MAG TPA: rRNA maturation RNase YbeY [Proteobacteria bacterium]|nr:endoribonuclease YbeY [bacterium BMS3Abin14]HDL54004.1 rRNA maturation RNase YbeY [Pseudomonadota bacterium]
MRMLKTLASIILKDLGRLDGELSLYLTDDAQIRELNREYRGIDSATDVLSFSQQEGETLPFEGAPCLLGDVVISMDRAKKQAREFGTELDAELRRLLTHGVLHLLGYDHEGSEEEADAMRKMEDRYVP